MISSLHPTRTSTHRKNKKKKTVTLTDAVRRVFAYQKDYPGQFGVFSVNRGLGISLCKVGSVRFKSLLSGYPDSLIGIYDIKLTVNDLIDDLNEYFSDEVTL